MFNGNIRGETMTTSKELKQNKIFRSMWADDYSTIDDMVERFFDITMHDENRIRIEIHIAINTLNMEMREAFLEQNYNKPETNLDEKRGDEVGIELNRPSDHRI